MNKRLILSISLAFLPCIINGNVLNNPDKIKLSSDRCSNISTVRLYNSSTLFTIPADGKSTVVKSIKGLVQVLASRSRFLCFPNSNEEYQQVHLFSHEVCRRQGFMSFISVEPKELLHSMYGLKMSSYNCFPQKHSTSYCEWNEEVVEYCRRVTAISCGACAGVFKGFRGMIKAPGFPFASFTDMTCEWRIIVPEHHSIFLSFNHFEALKVETAELMCGVHKPFIEIMYGIQSEVTITRYCQLSEVKNLSIPFNTATIRVFTGFTQRKETFQNKKKGIALTFEAIPFEDDRSGDPLKMILLTLLGLGFIACIVFCHYIEKYKLCNLTSKSRGPAEVEKMQELHMHSKKETEKQTLGLSVRFNGSEEKCEKSSYERIPDSNLEKCLERLNSLLEIPKEYRPVASHESPPGHNNKSNQDRSPSTNFSESDSSNRLSVPTVISF